LQLIGFFKFINFLLVFFLFKLKEDSALDSEEDEIVENKMGQQCQGSTNTSFSVNEFLQKQADLQEQNSYLINQNKIIQNKLNEASKRLTSRIVVQGLQQENIPKSNHAGFKSFVASKLWKTIKYVNDKSFANPLLIDKCYKALSIDNSENKESFFVTFQNWLKRNLLICENTLEVF
jgi:hypothetical protein